MKKPLERISSLQTQLSSMLPWVLVLLLTASTVVLVERHRSLQEEYQLHRRADLRVPLGSFLPAFSAVSTTGRVLPVAGGFGNGYQLLVLLTAECQYCAQMVPVWKTLFSEVASGDSADAKFLALTTDSMAVARAYADSNELPFPLIPFESDKYSYLFRAGLVPQTLVVDTGGRVIFARSGLLLTKASVDSVRKAFLSVAPTRVTGSGRAGTD